MHYRQKVCLFGSVYLFVLQENFNVNTGSWEFFEGKDVKSPSSLVLST